MKKALKTITEYLIGTAIVMLLCSIGSIVDLLIM